MIETTQNTLIWSCLHMQNYTGGFARGMSDLLGATSLSLVKEGTSRVALFFKNRSSSINL